jgi:predicted Zn finger-like uncharacterized protein
MTSKEPKWATPDQLRKLPRLIVWQCHHCGEVGFSNDMDKGMDGKPVRCRKCKHGYYVSDMISDSHNAELYRDDVRYTAEVVPEWAPDRPWTFAWFRHTCEVCHEQYWKPYDRLNVLKWSVDHRCKTVQQTQQETIETVRMELKYAAEHVEHARKLIGGMKFV